MAKYILELWLDGYENENDMIEACNEFIYDQLNMTASGVKFDRIEEETFEKDEFILYNGTSKEIILSQLICDHDWEDQIKINNISRYKECLLCGATKYFCSKEYYTDSKEIDDRF